jgi:hypothetical protein
MYEQHRASQLVTSVAKILVAAIGRLGAKWIRRFRFAIASACLSNVSSAIFLARLTSPVATPCAVKHHARNSWELPRALLNFTKRALP